jgi:hypothetical protein
MYECVYQPCHPVSRRAAPQNFLTVLQRSILRDKAVVEVFKGMMTAANPVQGIVGM